MGYGSQQGFGCSLDMITLPEAGCVYDARCAETAAAYMAYDRDIGKCNHLPLLEYDEDNNNYYYYYCNLCL
jgi:hypothetical protein